MSKAQQTKTRIIEQAAALFNQQGYAGSSMSDIMRVTGLQKGGIYNHFRSKDELALEAFDFAASRVQQKFTGALKGKRHAVDRLIAILSVYEHMLDDPPVQGGCPILNTAVESDDAHPALRERAQHAMDAWRGLIHRIVDKGVMRGELRADVNSDTVATILIATIEGGVMLSKLYGDASYLERALNHLKTYIQNQLAAHI
ncbi:TetR/AcrR family transcriptional regulator [Gloeocapsopsis crepidinum LEGE 06123]|uniref:TetR/AcrR family transcriptional regulator n=1 Tax=Gloeocapsopsis crepidinum LEGE 06123 TaxID=588587 RepID=A0ABR9UU06_9CHRO|nr:TetR/AcrR family transcriptional regulator [Gloeocapsopsis crepidinum]MBE9191749.1 TetR/AcrR family transcriptional regulator [Gloeocapsopsis crepidinum LEGE 06123]